MRDLRVSLRRWMKRRRSLQGWFMFFILFLTTAMILVLRSSQEIDLSSDLQYLKQLTEVEKMDFEGFNNETGVDHFLVPNVIHFIRFKLANYSFVDYVIMRAAMRNHRPDYFFIHSDVPPEDFCGKYWDLIRQDREMWSRIRILPLEPPSEIFGQELSEDFRLWHAADVERIRIIMKYGGIYLDNDVFVVQNLDKYRRFEIAVNWEEGMYLSNQVIIAHKDARFLAQWLDSYHEYRPESWYYNAGERPTIEILRKHPELIHRVEGWFGADSGVSRQIYDTIDYDWRIMDAIHLQIGDRIDLDRYYNETPVFDENTIQTYKYPFGAMARLVLDDSPGRA